MSADCPRDLRDSVVVVTGATSGIGAATARALNAAGANLVLSGRRPGRLDRLAEELGPERTHIVAGDIAVPTTSRRLVEAAQERFGRLDSLVASAGVGHYGDIVEGTDDDLIEMVNTNVLGTVWSVRAAVPALRASGGGDIVIVGSVAGYRGGPKEAVYASTKFAQVGLAGAIDRELRADGIRVTTICPAAVHTEFAIGTGRTEGDPWLDQVLQPEDVAEAVVFTLRQPRRLRTQTWTMWSMVEAS